MSSKIVSVSLQSCDRDYGCFPEPNDYEIDLGVRLKRVKELKLGSVEMPMGQYTIDEGCDTLHFDEGFRVDVGEAVEVAGVERIFNHQLVLEETMASTGTTRSFVLTVPAWLNEIEVGSPGTTTYSTVDGAPHGLEGYGSWRETNPDAPPVTPAAMCAYPALHFDDANDVRVLNESTFSIIRTDKLLENDRACVERGFLNGPALLRTELASLLTHLAGLQPTVNRYEFAFEGGRYVVRSRGSASVSLHRAPSTRSIGALMGFGICHGIKAHSRDQIFGGTPGSFVASLDEGMYDPTQLAACLGSRMSWGALRASESETAWGAQEVVGALGFCDSAGQSHAICLRGGRYFPETLAQALEYRLDRLDVEGVWHSSIGANVYGPTSDGVRSSHDFVGKVKYTVEFRDGRFRFAAARILEAQYTAPASIVPVSSIPTTFGLHFDPSKLPAASEIPSSCDVAAELLGFSVNCQYSGRSEYEGEVVSLPSMPNPLSGGPKNSAGRQPFHPAAQRYPRLAYQMSGTRPNTRRFRVCGEFAAPDQREMQDASATGRSATFEIASVGARGGVRSLNVRTGGSGFVVGEHVDLTSTFGSGAVARVTTLASSGSGVVSSVSVVSPGVGYRERTIVSGRRAPLLGRVRCVSGSNDSAGHTVVVCSNAATEALPRMAGGLSGAGGSEMLGNPRNASRDWRTTTAPLGFAPGDVVRLRTSALSAGGRAQTCGRGLTIAPTSVDALGGIQTVSVASGGEGYEPYDILAVQGQSSGGGRGAILRVGESGTSSLEVLVPGIGYAASQTYGVTTADDGTQIVPRTPTGLEVGEDLKVLKGGSGYVADMLVGTDAWAALVGCALRGAVASGLEIDVDGDGFASVTAGGVDHHIGGQVWVEQGDRMLQIGCVHASSGAVASGAAIADDGLRVAAAGVDHDVGGALWDRRGARYAVTACDRSTGALSMGLVMRVSGVDAEGKITAAAIADGSQGGYEVGDSALLVGGNNDASVRITQTGLCGEVLGASIESQGSGYTTGRRYETSSVRRVQDGGSTTSAAAASPLSALLGQSLPSGAHSPTALRLLAGEGGAASPRSMVVETLEDSIEQNAVVVEVVPAGENDAASRSSHPFVMKEPTAAYASTTRDGSALRLRVSNYSIFDRPGNVRLLSASSSPRFNLLVEGEAFEHTQRACARHLPRSIASRIGVLRDCIGAPEAIAQAQWNLDPWPYMLMRILDSSYKAANNLHMIRGQATPEVLAKLIISSPFTSVHAQLKDMGCGGYRDFGKVRIQFLNPDGSLVRFYGREHSLSLCFVIDSDDVMKPCI